MAWRCMDYPTKRVYRTGDEMPVTEEHGHSGKDVARPGFLMVCRGKVLRQCWHEDPCPARLLWCCPECESALMVTDAWGWLL